VSKLIHITKCMLNKTLTLLLFIIAQILQEEECTVEMHPRHPKYIWDFLGEFNHTLAYNGSRSDSWLMSVHWSCHISCP